MNEKRIYAKKDPPDMAKAIAAVQNRQMSQAKAAAKYKITRSRLQNRLKGAHGGECGHPTSLTKLEETELASTIDTVAQWKFCMSQSDIQQLVKRYCDRRNIKVFKHDNVPSLDWIRSFASRNNMAMRNAGNIKVARASVNEQQVRELFQNLEHLRDLEPSHIFNYDETNVTDDPGSKLSMVRRGTKRVENVAEHSKTSISLMACCSADGILLPPYVVYKAKNLYDGWIKGGPIGTRYGHTDSGWFDMEQFEKWFKEIFIRHIRHLDGTKLLIGDNLAAHFSHEVVLGAQRHDVYFTSLPPNSTNLLQPLDVAVFRPMKIQWRIILRNFRAESRKAGCIPKEVFPIMLYQLWLKMTQNKSCIKSGFRATGLYPRDVNIPLSKLPGTAAAAQHDAAHIRTDLDASLVDLLKDRTGENKVKKPRGKKIPPGQQITLSDEEIDIDATVAAVPVDSSTEDSSDENSKDTGEEEPCNICRIKFNETRDLDWIQCLQCNKWICGNCAEYDPEFVCVICEHGQ